MSKFTLYNFEEELSKKLSDLLSSQNQGDISSNITISGSLLEKNYLDLIMIRELEGMSSGADAGYWWDLLISDKENRQYVNSKRVQEAGNYGHIELTRGSLTGSINFEPHDVGFVTDVFKYSHDRPVSVTTKLVSELEKGQNTIEVNDYVISVKEVI